LLDVLPDHAAGDLRAMLVPLVDGTRKEIVFETAIVASGGRQYPAQICMQYFAEEHPPILMAIVQDTSERRTLEG
jgi:two-component system CheB/CheR fusion protein